MYQNRYVKTPISIIAREIPIEVSWEYCIDMFKNERAHTSAHFAMNRNIETMRQRIRWITNKWYAILKNEVREN